MSSQKKLTAIFTIIILVSLAAIYSLSSNNKTTHDPTNHPNNQGAGDDQALEQTPPPESSSQQHLFVINPSNSGIVDAATSPPTMHFKQPTLAYDFSSPLLAIIQKEGQENFTYKNIESLEERVVRVNEISPLVDIATSPTLSHIYLLGSLSGSNRTATLYKSSTNEKNLRPITTGSYTNVASLINEKVLLFSYADGNDLSQAEIFDTTNDKSILRQNANHYSISPNKNLVILSSSAQDTLIQIQPFLHRQLPTTKPHNAPVWITNEILLIPFIRRDAVDYQYIDLNGASTEKRMLEGTRGLSIRQIIGSVNENLVMVDRSNKIHHIPLPNSK